MKKRNLNLYLIAYTKIDHRPKHKSMTVFHISRKDVGENIYDFRVDKDFLERKVKALTSK